MGVSLDYISTDVIPAEIRAAIEADANRVNGERRWWCESLCFFDWPGTEGKLAGSTKLFLPGYSTDDGGYVEVDPADDSFMVARDLRFIVDQLARWSADHGINWRLAIEGGEIGVIAQGEIDVAILNVIAALPLLACEDPEGLLTEADDLNVDDEERAARIDEKYASRWE